MAIPEKDRKPVLGNWGMSSVRLLLLLVALLAGLPLAVWLDLSNISVTSAQLQSANLKIMINEIRGYYATQIVGRVKPHSGKSQVVHNYRDIPGAIPVPATLSLELADIFRKTQTNIGYRFVSDLTFKNRPPHQFDEWERAALASLRAQPLNDVIEVKRVGLDIRYRLATPVVMTEACVGCHNAHPESPKQDWKVGEVRGFQEVTVIQPVVSNLNAFKYLLLYLVVTAGIGFWFIVQIRDQAARVRQANLELEGVNSTLSENNEALSVAHQAAEASQQQAMRALEELRAAQTHLIQSEKMASLGQLVANVAHEINTPIGAVKSSGRNIADELDKMLESIARLFQLLDEGNRSLFMKLIHHANESTAVLSSREERAYKREVSQKLEAEGIKDATHKAGILVQLHAQSALADYLPLLRHPECDFILDTAHSVATIINNTNNINIAVERVSKIIFALKSFSRMDSTGEMTDANVQDGLETVLTIYQNQIRQGVELVRQYEATPLLRCLPDELNQVWTNLIHNALQAMNNKGTLTIGIRRESDDVLVSVGDTGHGIPEDIRSKIFDVFFTTKPSGEGSGLGLDIVKKIVDKHQGRIEVHSEVGVGTTFLIYLPLNAAVAA